MKRSNGFTLIELLAVIVILAVIALIATPLVMNVIDTAKKGAAEQSAYGYMAAVENKLAIDMLSGSTVDLSGTFTDSALDIKGKKPTAVKLTLSEGVVKTGTMTIDGYPITITDGEAKAGNK